jgi:hypothetical protein
MLVGVLMMHWKLVLTILSGVLFSGSAFGVEIDHHKVVYLGTADNGDGSSTAFWAVTENGCAIASSRARGRGGGGGKPPKDNCNSMSHFAVSDFLCDDADLVWPLHGELFYTVIVLDYCAYSTCLETVYKFNTGRSKPDGPGDWFKYSNHTSDPQTVQLEKDLTHVFTVQFYNGGRYDEGMVTAAIKSGKKVPTGLVGGPACK